jgi:hypothetical protein
MGACVPLRGTVLVEEALPDSEILQRIREALEPIKDDAGAAILYEYPITGCPRIRPEFGFLTFVSAMHSFFHLTHSPLLFLSLTCSRQQPERLVLREHHVPLPKSDAARAANHARNEELRAAAGERKRKGARKATTRHHGEKVEESNEDDDDDEEEILPGRRRLTGGVG